MARPRKPIDMDEVRQLATAGVRPSRIAAWLGVTSTIIYRRMDEAGIPRPHLDRSPDPRLAVACAYCEAVPGSPCLRGNGARADLPHSDRIYAYEDAIGGPGYRPPEYQRQRHKRPQPRAGTGDA